MAVATHLFHSELRHLPTRGLRSVSSWQVLDGLGQVFAVEQGDCSAGDRSPPGQEVPRVDIFVSQSWSAGRWQKSLGLCYHLNYTLAVTASMFTYAAAAVMLLLHAGSVSQLAGSPLIYPLTVDLPLTVFFLMFFFGHVLTCGCLSPSIWVDKLCIPQGDEAIKEKYVRALPDFVQRCSTMLVLWDATYFERLFCNMELAVFLKYQSGRHLVVLPLWLPPWLLLAVLFDWVSVRCLVFRLLGWAEGFFLNLPLPASYPHLEALLRVLLYTLVTGCAYLPAGVAAAISFSMKLKQHGEMLERLASFDVRYAKCTVGADRPIIEATIAQLYDEIDDLPISVAVEAPEVASAAAVSRQDSDQLLAHAEIIRDPVIRGLTSYPSQEESLDAFNMEVRGPLRAEIIRQSGSATSLPLSVCTQAFAPFFFYICSSCFLDCDGLGGCAAALKAEGFDSFKNPPTRGH